MPDVLIRGVDAHAVERLKARAKQNGRSFQSEAKLALERSAGPAASPADMVKILEKWKKRFEGRKFSSTVDDLREDRER